MKANNLKSWFVLVMLCFMLVSCSDQTVGRASSSTVTNSPRSDSVVEDDKSTTPQKTEQDVDQPKVKEKVPSEDRSDTENLKPPIHEELPERSKDKPEPKQKKQKPKIEEPLEILDAETPVDHTESEENVAIEVHVHDWIPIYETVYHDEIGHMQTEVVWDAWDETTYEPKILCSTCGKAFDCVEDVCNHIDDFHNGMGSYEVTDVPSGVIHHPEETEERWVVDQAAWEESVITGYRCDCGATKE